MPAERPYLWLCEACDADWNYGLAWRCTKFLREWRRIHGRDIELDADDVTALFAVCMLEFDATINRLLREFTEAHNL